MRMRPSYSTVSAGLPGETIAGSLADPCKEITTGLSELEIVYAARNVPPTPPGLKRKGTIVNALESIKVLHENGPEGSGKRVIGVAPVAEN